MRCLAARIALAVSVLIASLVIAELVLRHAGHVPGYVPLYSNKEFKPVDELELSDKYFTDEEGIFRANPDVEWFDGPAWEINADGFRSIPFERVDDGKSSILLLGDSFAWGIAAQPITNCFASLLADAGYRVFNTGIPAADPNQYAVIAEKYAPALEPDIFAVALYTGNDIFPARPMLPGKNIVHVTNVGWLQAFTSDGTHLSPEDAYRRYLAKSNRVELETVCDTDSIVYRLAMKTVIGTRLWLKLGPAPEDETYSTGQKDGSYAVRRAAVMEEAHGYLERIRAAAESCGAEFFLFVIPVHPELEGPATSVESNMLAFEGLNPLIPSNIERSDYRDLPNDHFNNEGHRKFAEFMLSHLSRKP